MTTMELPAQLCCCPVAAGTASLYQWWYVSSLLAMWPMNARSAAVVARNRWQSKVTMWCGVITHTHIDGGSLTPVQHSVATADSDVVHRLTGGGCEAFVRAHF